MYIYIYVYIFFFSSFFLSSPRGVPSLVEKPIPDTVSVDVSVLIGVSLLRVRVYGVRVSRCFRSRAPPGVLAARQGPRVYPRQRRTNASVLPRGQMHPLLHHLRALSKLEGRIASLSALTLCPRASGGIRQRRLLPDVALQLHELLRDLVVVPLRENPQYRPARLVHLDTFAQ